MPDLSPKLVRAFLAIDSARSVTRAAKVTGVSQPTMSGHLRRLRSYFHDPLFIANGVALTPSEVADAVRPDIVEIARALDALSTRTAPWLPGGSKRRFRLMASGYVQDLLAGALHVRIKAAGRNLGLEVVHPARQDDIDACIGPRQTVPPDRKMRFLFEDRLVCLLDPALRDADGSLGVDLFCDLEHLLVAPAPSPPHQAVDEALRVLGRARRIGLVVHHAGDLAPLLRDARRLAVLPARSAIRYADALWLADVPVVLPRLSFAMSWPSSRAKEPGSVWFREQIVSVAKSLIGRRM